MQIADGYVLAFDFGLRHIGVAVGNTLVGHARGVTTLAATNGKPQWREITALIKDHDPYTIVVGKPLNMDGTEFDMTERAGAFAQALARRCKLPVISHDERLTSKAAEWDLEDARATGRARDDHQLAACLILESALRERAQA